MKKARPVFIIIFSALFLFSGIMLIREISLQKEEQNNFDKLASLVVPETKPTQPQKPQPDAPTEEATPKRNLEPLFAKNDDCVGWLYIEETKVDYPVMHTPEEPQRYLRRNFDGKRSTAGVPFIEGSCTLDCINLIVYGHNMRNGTMFADITKYRNEDYCKEHPVIEFETAQGMNQYTVFAVVRLKGDDEWYDFHTAANEEKFNEKIAEIKSRALYDAGITPTYGNQLITLSTCYGTNDEDRIIVIGTEIH